MTFKKYNLSRLRGLLRRYTGGPDDNGLVVQNACKMGNAKFQEIVRITAQRTDDKRRRQAQEAGWTRRSKRLPRYWQMQKPSAFHGQRNSCEAMEVGLHLGSTWRSSGLQLHSLPRTYEWASRKPGAWERRQARPKSGLIWQSTGLQPLESMPRHMSRYSIYPRGYWTRRGR